MRKLKDHERRLLKKVDFLQWKRENEHREIQVIRRYHIQNREDYTSYNRICGLVTKLASMLTKLDADDPTRMELTDALLQKLYDMGLLQAKRSLAGVEKLSTAAFCRRRLSVVMVRLKMSETLKEACTFIEQGHVRVGPSVVTDPAFLVTRNMEDFVTWVDTSKIRSKIMKYNDQYDDYELLE